MKKEKCENRKLNNRGISLLEVIIAVAILSVAVGAMLQIFVYSSRLNSRARERQHVNVAAESLMEGFKGYDIEQICRQFSHQEEFKIYNGGGSSFMAPLPGESEGEADARIAARFYTDVNGEIVFKPAADHTYAFGIQRMKVDGKEYDAYIKVNPVNDASGVKTWTVADVNNINPYKDAIYRQDATKDINCIADIKHEIEMKMREIICFQRELIPTEAYLTYNEPDADMLDMEKIKIEKHMFVTIEDTNVHLSVVYHYRVDPDYDLGRIDGEPDVIGTNPEDAAKSLIEGDWQGEIEDIYSYSAEAEGGTGALLGNVYLFYYPAYPDATGIDAESIELFYEFADGFDRSGREGHKLEEKNQVKVYLLKQKRPGFSDASIQIAEGSYTSHLTVDGSSQNLILYHNLDRNLISGKSMYYPTITGSMKIADALSAPRTDSPILEDADRVLLYQVEVNIYSQDLDFYNIAEATPLLTLKGSINSK